MAVRREDIIGRRIIHIWAGPKDQLYNDHLVELDSGAFVKFSWGELERGDPSNYPGVWEEKPSWALCAPACGDPVPTCIGCRIEAVLYSQVPYVDTGQFHRAQVYLLLDDGRYLTSGLGFNYTELEADRFERWYASNKRADLLYDHWTDRRVNPFGPDAISGDWNGLTLIGPAN